MSSKDGEEECLMLSSSDNIKLTPYSDANDVDDQHLSHFVQNIKQIQKHQWKKVILFFTQFS